MYNHVATQNNISILKKRGVIFIDPDKGELACGEFGEGRLASVEEIYKSVTDVLKSQEEFAGVNAVVTAGGPV